MTTKLLPQLGIATKLAGKVRDSGVDALISGQSEIAIQPVSELLRGSGVDFVGPIPADIQYTSVFSAAVVTGSKVEKLPGGSSHSSGRNAPGPS